jgi:hypothetical protein
LILAILTAYISTFLFATPFVLPHILCSRDLSCERQEKDLLAQIGERLALPIERQDNNSKRQRKLAAVAEVPEAGGEEENKERL